MKHENYANHVATTTDPNDLAKAAVDLAWQITEGLGIECNCPHVRGQQEQVCNGSCTHSLAVALADSMKRIGDEYLECEGCSVLVPEDRAIPINDGTIDWTPKVCSPCAGGE